MKVLIVDDDPANRKLVRLYVEMLKCEVIEAENGQEGLEMAVVHKPDLIISDAKMPVMDGFQFLRKIKGDNDLRSIPFIFYSGFYTGDKEYELAMSLGAKAVIAKPKTPAEFQDELSSILEECRTKKGEAIAERSVEEEEYLREYSRIVVVKLEEKVRELEAEISERRRVEEELKKSETSYRELSVRLSHSLEELKERETSLMKSKEAFLNMLGDVTEAHHDLQELFTGLVRAMVNALDAKSQWTKGHSLRVARYAEEIAKEIGLEESEIKNIHLAGLLHDIGKIGTYDYLLDKPAKLTNEEFEVVKKHPAQGESILRDIKQLKDILPFIRHHHERIDGRGYPDGLKGDDISFGARILHVADTFDAIMADRPYRPSPGLEYAVSEFTKYAGQQFDPKVAEVFLGLLSTQKMKL
jgi:putative nucleotidyltransferase with HDIG domain